MSDQKEEKLVFAKNLKASNKLGDNLIQGFLNLDLLKNERVKKLIFEYEGKQYLRILILKRKLPDQFGKTHVLLIDTFVPKPREEKQEVAK